MPNQPVHLTPKARAFFSLAISEQNVAFAKSSLAFGAGDSHVICEECNMHRCTQFLFESANIVDTKRSMLLYCFFVTGAESKIASSYSVVDVTVPTFLLTFVNEFKLRPFALTVDNGFMPHETMQNIDNRILLCYLADVAKPASFGNDRVSMQWLPRFHKKGRHENSSRQRSGHSNRG